MIFNIFILYILHLRSQIVINPKMTVLVKNYIFVQNEILVKKWFLSKNESCGIFFNL